jgi:hypothetical protein
MILRILETDWQPFSDALCETQELETAGIVLAQRIGDGDVLLARHLLLIPEDGYLIRKADQIRIEPIALNRLVRRARAEQLSILTIHTHPNAADSWFSFADNEGDARLIPSLFAQTTGPHGSMVLAGRSRDVVARVWREDGTQLDVDLRVCGNRLQMYGPERREECDERCFDRQRLALGRHGQDSLKRLHVGVVGLGGTGSVCFAQLVHLGVGTITAIDSDTVESTNVSRVLGAGVGDANRTSKVDVARRYAEAVGFETTVNIVRLPLNSASLRALDSCDVVLSCVDRHQPRALLNRFSYENAVPVIDMGTAFRVDNAGVVTGAAGRVVVIGPGRRCLGCWGHIDPNRLRIESLSPEDRAREANDGYVEGSDVPQPSVIAFNTTVAGAAIVELLRLVTGFAGTNDPPARLSFDFLTGAVRRNRLAEPCDCSICGAQNRADIAIAV